MKTKMQRVLFVEPNQDEHHRLKTTINPTLLGWEFTFCTTGDEALDLNIQNAFDIIITTNNLSDMTGVELLNSIKVFSPETIRFLVITKAEAGHFRGPIQSAQQMLDQPIDITDFTAKARSALGLRESISNSKMFKLIGSTDSLPSLPRVFAQLSSELNNPLASLDDIGKIISEDIVLSSKVLKVANSALFNLAQPAQTISHAVSLLGINAVSSIVLSESIAESFDSSLSNFAEALNKHSLCTGALAFHFLKKRKQKRPVMEQAVFCGIMHDIGKLVLAQFAPNEWPDVIQRSSEAIRPDIQIERAALGVGHSEVSAYLLSIWGFSNDIVAPVAFHHEPSKFYDQENELLCALHVAENCCPTTIHGQELDWAYLNNMGVTEKHIKKLNKYIEA